MIKKESLTVSAFYERFSALSDDRIMDILQNQKDYQEAARNAATQIAVERSLIHSADDLLAPEFQNSQNAKFSFFPSISNEYHRNRLIASFFRFLFIFSLLPVIFGILRYAKGDLIFSALGVGSGIIWFFLVFIMKRSQKSSLVFPLLFLVLIAGIYLFIRMIHVVPFRFIDFFMLCVGIALPVYFLLYVKKLIDTE